MSETLDRVQALAGQGAIRISAHGYDELADDDIFATDALSGLASAVLVEDYPNAVNGPCVLVLQSDADGRPIHVVWGIQRDREGPPTLVTAYRPDPARWSGDFLTRKRL
jgi:hypothetical protein